MACHARRHGAKYRVSQLETNRPSSSPMASPDQVTHTPEKPRRPALTQGCCIVIVLSLIKSYRAMSHKVVPVRLFASIISRQADGEIGKASWYAVQAIRGLSSPIKADLVSP